MYGYTLWEGWDEWDRDVENYYFDKVYETPRMDALFISS
jgi:hypothetical protein